MNEGSAEQMLRVLGGLRLRCIGRAADLLWMHFGEFREVPARGGGTREVGEWALHIQTPWRFTRGPVITVGTRDFYYYADGGEDYDWDKGGVSRFDRLASTLNCDFEAVSYNVTSIVCDRVGGFSLWFGPEVSFDVFPNVASTSPGFELWRMFQPATEEAHYVVETDDPERL